MKPLPPPRNAWLVGYTAAMRAQASDLNEAGESAALEIARKRFTMGEVAASAFRAGWRSVLRVERSHEVPS